MTEKALRRLPCGQVPVLVISCFFHVGDPTPRAANNVAKYWSGGLTVKVACEQGGVENLQKLTLHSSESQRGLTFFTSKMFPVSHLP